MMKNLILIIIITLVHLNLLGQNIYSSSPDRVYNFNFYIPWWDQNYGSNFVPALDSIDEQRIFTEVCPSSGSDTLFFGNFEFNLLNFNSNSLIYLELTKSKAGSNIKDAYLAVTYNGQIISDNLADTLNFWADNDSTTTYVIDNSSLQITLDINILNDSTFGFIFSTSPSDPYCMNSYLNAVKLKVNEDFTAELPKINSNSEIVEIFPNPSNAKVNIVLNDMKNPEVRVFNAQGQLIYEYRGVQKDILQIELKNQVAGMYYVIVSNENVTKTFKLFHE